MAAVPSIYTTPTALTEAGVPVSTWAQSRVNRLIASTSSFIDRVTSQRFICYEETIQLSGDSRGMLYRPDLLPILSVSAIEVSTPHTTGFGRVFSGTLKDIAIQDPTSSTSGFPSDTFEIDLDSIRLQPHNLARYMLCASGVFPGGVGNISVTGVFGWPEASSVLSPVGTGVTDDAITTSSTSFNYTVGSSLSGVKPRDVLIIAGYPVIVIAHDTSTRLITHDPLAGIIPATIASGAAISCYAAVPHDIERATIYLAMREAFRMNSFAAGNTTDPFAIQEEQTDSYRYKVFSGSQQLGFGRAPGLTGIAEVDQILLDYTAPLILGFA